MYRYVKKVNYYETDKMGITHHSNYIRFMEEARVAWMDSIGCSYKKLEELGISSPVIKVECEYKYPTTFEDEIEIFVNLIEYNGVRITVEYIMKLMNKTVFFGKSQHCFLNDSGFPIKLKKDFENIDKILNKELEYNQEEKL